MEKKTILGILSGCLWGIISAALACVIPPIGTLFAPGLMAIVGVRAGMLGFALAETGFAAASLLLLGGAGLGVIAQCTFPALAMIYFSKRVSRFETLVFTSGGALLGNWTSIGINSLLTGENKMAEFFAMPAQFVKSQIDFIDAQVKQIPELSASSEQFKAVFSNIEMIARSAAPAILIGSSMLIGLVTVLMVSRSVRKSLKPGFVLPPFSKWHLPRSFALGMMAILVFSIMGEAQGWNNFEAISLCAQLIFYSAYTLSGCATIDALLIRVKTGKALRWILSLSLLIITTGYVTMWVGIIDSLFGIRRRMERSVNP